MNRWHLLSRRARSVLWTALSIVIIALAVMAGIAKLLMPYSERYQPELEAWLSAEFGREVKLESFRGELGAFGPRLSLRGMRFVGSASEGGGIAIEEAALDVKPLNLLLPGRALYSFRVIGADLHVVRAADGEVFVSGLGLGGGDTRLGAGLRYLVGIGELLLEDSRLFFEDEQLGSDFEFSTLNAHLQLSDKGASFRLQAELRDTATGILFGDVESTAIVELEPAGYPARARWQASFRDVILGSAPSSLPRMALLPRDGRLNAELWGDWVRNRPLVIRGKADLRDAGIAAPGSEVRLAHFNASFLWRYQNADDWRLDLNELAWRDAAGQWHVPRLAVARNGAADTGIWISGDLLPLDLATRWGMNFAAVAGREWPAFLPRAGAGSLSDFEIWLDRDGRLRKLEGLARGLQIEARAPWPALQGVDIEFQFGGAGGEAYVHAGNLTIDWPGMFAESLELNLPGCRAEFDWSRGWQLSTRGCSVFNDDLAVIGDVLISGNAGRPAVDMNFHVQRGDISRLGAYWPERGMSAKVVAWLRRSLVSGRIDSGRVQVRGDLDHFPFRGGEGRFEASARVSDAELRYHPDWPAVNQLAATVEFSGPAMRVEAHTGLSVGAGATAARAWIDDLRQPMLGVAFQAGASLDSLIEFVHQSPLKARVGYDLGRFTFAGPTEVQGTLQIPLGRMRGETTVDGQVRMLGNRFEAPEHGLRLDGIRGGVGFDRTGIEAQGLTARYQGEEASLDLVASSSAADRFRAELVGRFDVQDMLPVSLRDALAELQQARGVAEWKLKVVVPRSPAGRQPAAEVQVVSDLVGVELGLPAPLRKPAGVAWPLELSYALAGEPRLLHVAIHDRLRLLIEMADPDELSPDAWQVRRAVAHLGAGRMDLPDLGKVRILGDTTILELDDWTDLLVDAARAGRGLSGLDLESFSVRAGTLSFLDRWFDDVLVGVELDRSTQTTGVRARFEGQDITGQVSFQPGRGNGSLSAEFERLALGKPLTEGVEMRSRPGELPELHLYARSFRYAGVEMGETRIEAYPTAEGFHFEKVESRSDAMTVRASGDWTEKDGQHRSDFAIVMTTESLGDFLQSLDFSSALEGGQTLLQFDAWWPGTPAAFALARLNGKVEFSVSRGQITTASSGGGRLLGLLSVQALPRRLALDFRDVFDSGFAFDEASGTFRMENGMATTDDVELSSSAAEISLTGSTDLVGRKYDQVIVVRPGVGNTLPVIGAIAGGPGGAAAGLALQGLLQEELGEATQVRYAVTGSWDQPDIVPILREEADG